ncbi:MAG: 30S ribosomal protein S17 [Planctomycetes bacterium]|nr:30S ribosomal protein S17 [Planctomycetota bacterium]
MASDVAETAASGATAPDRVNLAGAKTGQRANRIGVVKSNKMQKTITVVVERLVKHPLYKKYVRKRTVLKVHDEKNVAKIGSVVEVEFSRPLSKTKRWNLVRVLRAGEEG